MFEFSDEYTSQASEPRACFQTSLSDLDPPKSPLKRGTLTKFSPLDKGGWGGSNGLKTRPRGIESLQP